MVLALVGRIVAAGLLFWALADHPYGYFILLRFVVCAVGAYCAFAAYAAKEEQWAWVFGLLAVLFNPIIPVHMNRQVWSVVDVVVGAIMLGSLASALKRKG
jgi:arginine exporter protein ArgO